MLSVLLLTTCVWAVPGEQVIFSLEATPGADAYLEPIAIRRGGRWLTPTSTADSVQMGKDGLKFIENYYRPGSQYPVVGGGQVSIKGSESARTLAQDYVNGSGGAWSLAAEASAPAMARPRGLVVSSAPGRPHPAARSAAREQHASFLNIFKKGPGKSLKWRARARVRELWQVDLDGDGQKEWLGTLQGGSEDYGCGWMLVGAKNQVLFSHMQSAMSLDYLDQFDVDGDGVGEVFLRLTSEGGHGFHVYSRLGGKWKEVYSGGGGGC